MFLLLIISTGDSDYLFDDEHVSQRKIETELFEKFDKESEKSLSILKFIFVIVGFYSVFFVNIYGKFDINLIFKSSPYPPESNYSIILCSIMVLLAFLFSFKPLTMERYKFVETNRSVRYRDGPELEKNNRRVSLNVRRQGILNMIAVYCILFSFLFFLGYFFRKEWFVLTASLALYAGIDIIEEWTAIYQIEQEGREGW